MKTRREIETENERIMEHLSVMLKPQFHRKDEPRKPELIKELEFQEWIRITNGNHLLYP